MSTEDQSHTDQGGGDPYASIVYRSQLSPELREDKAIMEAVKDSPKLNDLVKSHAALKARAARSVVIPNAEKPDPAEVKAFRAIMGLPEKAEEYAFDSTAFKDIEGVDQVVALCRADAAAMGLTKAQAQKHFESIMGLSKAGRDQVAKTRKEAADAFEPTLLDLVGKSEEKAKATKNLFKSLVVRRLAAIAEKAKPGEGSKLVQRMAGAGMFTDAVFTVVGAELATLLGEEPFADGAGNAHQGEKAAKGRAGAYDAEFEKRYGKRKGGKQ